MLNKAVDTDLLVKNVARQINTIYYNLFVLALETGMRIGELCALQRKDISFAYFSPRTLRHTFATRAIERGMNPKTLQKILGHGTLQMTMGLYCHVTEDTLYKEMEKFERGCILESNGVVDRQYGS